MSLQAVQYVRGEMRVLDQLKLPLESEYVPIKDSRDAWAVIRSMQVRGAPLIAIVAALGLAVEANGRIGSIQSPEEAQQFLLETLDYLRTSRPTAVNLFQMADTLAAAVRRSASAEGATADSVLQSFIDDAEATMQADVATNVALSNFGAARILELVNRPGVRVLTICNTGSLATAGYGTALGVVRSLHSLGRLERVYACETRPYNQGARLTAFEIVTDKLPGTLITDSMAATLMARRGVDVVVVGADRVAANGDTANKVGTYQLAIVAKYHGVPFFVAAPSTTLDASTMDGAGIHIEERPEDELTTIFGVRIAPVGIAAWNPAFDVTPSSLIAGVITERGVIGPSVKAANGTPVSFIDVAGFLAATVDGQLSVVPVPVADTAVPVGFRRLDEDGIKEYILANDKLRGILGLTAQQGASSLTLKEVGDGNINFVYIVSSDVATVVIKQALPYIRCVGEGWPLTLERSKFEMLALTAHGALCPSLVPRVLHFDETFALMAMQYIPPPHVILRRALIAKTRISCFADIARYMALTLAGTSTLALDGPTYRTAVAEWSRNTSMCAVTEQVIFSDPYVEAPLNKHNSPHLDAIVKCIRSDCELLQAASVLKGKFLGHTQALLHGDLHSGSIMVSESSTFVIDPEFAFYGPMGFDLGALLSNLFFSYFSQEPAAGFDQRAESRESEFAAWVIEQIALWHSTFEREFTLRFEELSKGKGEFFTGGIASTPTTLAVALRAFLSELWLDTLGFAGMKMTRRIIGLAHVADLEEIEDPAHRSVCEKKCLLLARILVVSSQERGSAGGQVIGDMPRLLSVARKVYALPASSVEGMDDFSLKWKVLY